MDRIILSTFLIHGEVFAEGLGAGRGGLVAGQWLQHYETCDFPDVWELVFPLSLGLVKPLVALHSSLGECNVGYVCLVFIIYSGSGPTS